MADEKDIRGAADATRINVKQDHEVRYWTKVLGVTAARLRQAVTAVGPMVAAVKHHLKFK
jgi:cyanate permease